MHFKYFTFLVYSPRGQSEKASQSRNLAGKCKNGDILFAELLADEIIKEGEQSFFKDTVLIPAPRSAPLTKGAVFPTKVLADKFVMKGLGNGVYECIQRIKPIPKSSSQYSAETRNSVRTHLDSLALNNIIIPETTIIIVDDILTLGRTSMACALKLSEIYSEKEIKIFCPFRTRSFEDNNILKDIRFGEMTLSNNEKVILPD